MKMNRVFTVVIALLVFALRASGQYQTVMMTGSGPSTITIPAGQVMQVFNFVHSSDTGFLQLTKGGTTLMVLQSEGLIGGLTERYFTGPATIAITGSATTKVTLSYRIFDNATATGTTVPSTAVVIPADATGAVNIVLESSTDLVTWTPATPGSYGSSTSKRFFRVRAVAP